MTVGELLDAWLARARSALGKPGRGGLEQSSYNNYELQVRTLKATQLAPFVSTRSRTRQPVEETYEALEEVLGPARMSSRCTRRCAPRSITRWVRDG